MFEVTMLHDVAAEPLYKNVKQCKMR